MARKMSLISSVRENLPKPGHTSLAHYFTVCAMMIIGTAQAEPVAWPDLDRAATAKALATAASARTVTIDMTDQLMLHFLKRQYKLAGITASSYPGLYKLMDKQTRVPAKLRVKGPKVFALTDDLQYEDLATVVLGVYPTAPGNYAANAVASMQAAQQGVDTLQLSYASLCFYDSDTNPIGTCVRQTSFNSGQYFPVNNSIASPPEAFIVVFTATYYDTTTKRFIAQMSTLDAGTTEYPSQQSITHPVIVHPANNPLKAALVCTSRTVNANGNPGVCDYGDYANKNVLVQMNGSIVYGPSQTPQVDQNGKLVGSGTVSLINTISGGQCTLTAGISGNNFFSQPEVRYVAGTKTLTWDFSRLDFGAPNNLICGGDGTAIQFSLFLQTKETGANPNPIIAAQYSVPGTIVPTFAGINAGALQTPMLRLVAGCLDPSTEVTLEDGVTIPIAKIQGEGEKLRSYDGNITQVAGTVKGTDGWLYEVRASNGMKIRATAQHPFVTADGDWRATAKLKVGQKLRTSSGIATITSIRKQSYRGSVINLLLAHAPNDVRLSNETFYANGFLVGGHDAQQEVAASTARTGMNKRIPPDFRIDYQSHLKSHAAAAN